MKQESLSGFNSIEGLQVPDKVDATMFGAEEEQWITISTGHSIICPDIFGIRHLGTADNYRGRLVRAFAIILDYVWPA